MTRRCPTRRGGAPVVAHFRHCAHFQTGRHGGTSPTLRLLGRGHPPVVARCRRRTYPERDGTGAVPYNVRNNLLNTRSLEKFAQAARRQLQEQVASKLARVLQTDSAELRGKAAAIQKLQSEIAQSSRAAVIERVAYTWFNRFCALRYMDANHYTRIGTVSPAPGFTQPELLQEAKQGQIDADLQVDRATVLGLLNGQVPARDPQAEAYRLLLVAECNRQHTSMPFLFERIDD